MLLPKATWQVPKTFSASKTLGDSLAKVMSAMAPSITKIPRVWPSSGPIQASPAGKLPKLPA